MTLLILVAMPLLVSGAELSFTLDGVKSSVDVWPAPKLQNEAAASLARSAQQPDAGFVIADPEVRADVALRGLLAPTKDGAGVRFTWALKTQGCPMLTDQVAWDFKSTRLSPLTLDVMSAQLAKRAQVLVEKARAQNATVCIPIEGFGRGGTVTRPPTPKPTPPKTQTMTQPAPFPTVSGWRSPGAGVSTPGAAGPDVPPSNY